MLQRKEINLKCFANKCKTKYSKSPPRKPMQYYYYGVSAVISWI